MTGAALAAPLSAQVTEDASIENSYTYTVGGISGSGTNAGGNVAVDRSVTTASGISEMGLSLTGTLDEGSFFFLHNGYCVGSCTMALSTNITFALTNTGSTPVDLRFDSQITPGHLANSFLGEDTNSTANFAFSVSQDPGLRQGVIYTASGTAVTVPPSVTTSDGEGFANFIFDSNTDPNWNVLDWSATDLMLPLATIAPGATTNLFYRSTLTITTDQFDCANPTLCESLQVAFGDPRNAGGVVSRDTRLADPMTLSALASAFNALTLSDVLAGEQNPAVGAIFDPFRVTYRFVEITAPPSFPPSGALGPVEYNVNYRSPIGAVPEPATWLMMLLGFFLLGAQMRSYRSPEDGTLQTA
ncbi:PEPxxWA-CTERM sorting domain-containing protein [Qipengyuania atrilutea]|nr:PEPxxWA-CTERM sorting domain-containing protein [Actirhodobacter atriluteus]